MKSILNLLKGTIIEKVLFVEDYVQLYFNNTAILSIYNNYTASKDLKYFESKSVSLVEETEEKIKLIFEDSNYILIDLRQEAYNSPEAVNFCISDQLYVWTLE